MSIRRVVPNITSDTIEASRKLYTDFLGFQVAMDMGWILTLVSPSNPTAKISIIRGTSSASPYAQVSLSIEVDDVDDVHAQAFAFGVPMSYPLSTKRY